MLSKASFIERVYTQYGNPPSGGCDADDADTETPVFYEAEYYSYAPVLREKGALCQPINAPFVYTAPLGLIVRSPLELERFLRVNGTRLA